MGEVRDNCAGRQSPGPGSHRLRPAIHIDHPVDDYGHRQGSRKAVDDYFADTWPPVLLSRIDYTGCLAVKTRWIP